MIAYFYCVPTEDRDEVPYQHLLLALAEGLTALGIACYANIDYWPLDLERSTYLLRHDAAVAPEDCAIVIVSDDWAAERDALPERHRGDAACWIALDREDGSRLRSLAPAYRRFDFVLRTHYNRDTRYGANFVPWAYGLTERIIESTRAVAPARRRVLLANWRHTRNRHSLRLAVERSFLPQVSAGYSQSMVGARRSERTAGRRTGAFVVARNGPPALARVLRAADERGRVRVLRRIFAVTPWPAAKESRYPSRALKRALTLAHRRTYLISQWDSWRLWESLAAGCATMHVDLERYGCTLPVMPVNWEHYIGVDLERPLRRRSSGCAMSRSC